MAEIKTYTEKAQEMGKKDRGRNTLRTWREIWTETETDRDLESRLKTTGTLTNNRWESRTGTGISAVLSRHAHGSLLHWGCCQSFESNLANRQLSPCRCLSKCRSDGRGDPTRGERLASGFISTVRNSPQMHHARASMSKKKNNKQTMEINNDVRLCHMT